MLKLGNVVKNKESPSTLVDVSRFSIKCENGGEWSQPVATPYLIEEKPFAVGGFRQAFKAKIHANGRCYVIKRYRSEIVKEHFDAINETPENHTKNLSKCRCCPKTFWINLIVFCILKGMTEESFCIMM